MKGGKSAPNETQPAQPQPPKILSREPTSSLSEALAQAQKQVDQAK